MQAQQPTITTAEFSAKYRSKCEVYYFLNINVGVYLPPKESCTIYYLRGIITGQKKFINAIQIRQLAVPHYSGLKIEELLSWAQNHHELFEYLPDKQDLDRVPRAWVANMIYTVVGDAFKTYVDDRIEDRNQSLINKRDLNISMDPQILNAFKQSTNVSTMNGRGVHILKAGAKRRRTKANIEDQFEFERDAQENASANASKVKQQRAELEELERAVKEREEMLNNGNHLFEWMQEQVKRGKIEYDINGRPNIIGNAADQDFDDDQIN